MKLITPIVLYIPRASGQGFGEYDKRPLTPCSVAYPNVRTAGSIQLENSPPTSVVTVRNSSVTRSAWERGERGVVDSVLYPTDTYALTLESSNLMTTGRVRCPKR